MRICDECKVPIMSAFVIDDNTCWYCSRKCLNKHYTDEQYAELYDNGDGDSYWTDFQYTFCAVCDDELYAGFISNHRTLCDSCSVYDPERIPWDTSIPFDTLFVEVNGKWLCIPALAQIELEMKLIGGTLLET